MPRKEKSDNDTVLKELLVNLSKNLIKHRKQQGLTQLQLASKANLVISTVSELERGNAGDIRLSTVTALAKVFEIDDPLKLLKNSK